MIKAPDSRSPELGFKTCLCHSLTWGESLKLSILWFLHLEKILSANKWLMWWLIELIIYEQHSLWHIISTIHVLLSLAVTMTCTGGKRAEWFHPACATACLVLIRDARVWVFWVVFFFLNYTWCCCFILVGKRFCQIGLHFFSLLCS